MTGLTAPLFARSSRYCFSFTALRLSKLAMELVGVLATLLQEAGASTLRRARVCVQPHLFLTIIYLYMSDLPFAAIAMASSGLLLRGLRRDSCLEIVGGLFSRGRGDLDPANWRRATSGFCCCLCHPIRPHLRRTGANCRSRGFRFANRLRGVVTWIEPSSRELRASEAASVTAIQSSPRLNTLERAVERYMVMRDTCVAHDGSPAHLDRLQWSPLNVSTGP
jgi:hypothetical protein